jgi:hypothetical protein
MCRARPSDIRLAANCILGEISMVKVSSLIVSYLIFHSQPIKSNPAKKLDFIFQPTNRQPLNPGTRDSEWLENRITSFFSEGYFWWAG